MIIVNKEAGDSIDKMLKRYKKKYTQHKVIDELRERKDYTKPSVKRRAQVLKAVYREKIRSSQEKNS